MREDIDKVTSFKRHRFLSRARIPGLVRNSTRTRICAKNSSKTTEECASALMSPYVGIPLNVYINVLD